MTLKEFLKVVDTRIEIWAFDDNSGFGADFQDIEIKDGSVLIGSFGTGPTPEEAIKNMIKEFSGKHLVKNSYQEDRQEFRGLEIE